jgi:hypothetical protein
MDTQIAFTLQPSIKQTFTKNLKAHGLTTKWFFLMCIHAFNEKKLFPRMVATPSDMVDVGVSAQEFLAAINTELTKRGNKGKTS